MRLVCGPPWLRVAVSFSDEGAARFRHFLDVGGAVESGDPADAAVLVRGLKTAPAAADGFAFRGGRLEANGEYGQGWYYPERGAAEVEVGDYGGAFLETFIRQVFLWETLTRGAVPLHGCAFARGGDVVVSCGPSGSGKSTLAMLVGGKYDVYSDEMNAVTTEGRAFALPFRGTGVAAIRTGGGRVGATTFHRPGPAWSARRMALAEATRALSANVFLPEAATGGVKARAFLLAAALVEKLPAYDVTVPLEPGSAARGFGELLGTDTP